MFDGCMFILCSYSVIDRSSPQPPGAVAAAGTVAAGAVAKLAAETWPAFTRGHNPATMVFGYTAPPGQVHERYRFDKCNFWDEQFAKLIPQQASPPNGER